MRTDRQTGIQTRWSQYFAHLPGLSQRIRIGLHQFDRNGQSCTHCAS